MNLRSASLLLFPVWLAACSDDGSGPNTGDQLTREEALMIASAVSGSVETTSAAPSVTTNGLDGVAADPITFTQDHESTHPCPRGGSVTLRWTVSGTADPEAGVFELDVEGVHQPAGCTYPHDGLTFTITGDPDLEFAAHVALANHQPSEPFTASIDGAFNWNASDGRSGRCIVQYQEVTDFLAKQRTVDGNVCGHTVKQTFSWS